MGTVVSTLAVGAVHILWGRQLGFSFLTPSAPPITCFVTELLSPRNPLSRVGVLEDGEGRALLGMRSQDWCAQD